jgi:Carboxypeptidase regulatory-like domain
MIYDPNGASVAGAKIQAKFETGGGFTFVLSNNDGSFSIDLVPGIYAIDVSRPGFITINYSEFLVVNSSNKKMSIDFVMFGGKYHEPCGYSGLTVCRRIY